MNRKKVLLIVLLCFIILTIILLTLMSGKKRYFSYIINDEKWNSIISNREYNNGLFLESIKFNEYSLFLDKEDNRLYYSINFNDSKKYNPNINYVSNVDGTKIAILNGEINEDKIKNNNEFNIMIYNDKFYHIYKLSITNLPILSIDYKDEHMNKNIPMKLRLFNNNSSSSFNKVVNSEGSIKVIDNSISEKDDYIFSLNQISLGRNKRENNISLLDMRKHSEYVLNSMSLDDNLVRNVFSTNLWNMINSSNNDNYSYVELFINGKYVGVYSLGYNIEKESLMLGHEDFIFYKSSFILSEETLEDDKLPGYVLYDRDIDRVKRKEDIFTKCESKDKKGCKNIDAWSILKEYYKTINGDDIDKIKKVSDIDSAIDIYLFYMLVEANDNINDETFSDTYLLFKKSIDGYKVSYYPWNLNNTFYDKHLSYSMKYNPVYRLIELKDSETINKVKNRYNELRKDRLSSVVIDNMLKEYESNLFSSGAYLRDSYLYDYSSNLTDLKNFKTLVYNRLDYMDKYISNL